MTYTIWIQQTVRFFVPLALTCLALLSPASYGQGSPAPSLHQGLVLIATTSNGFVLASDGSSANADGTISEAQKIFPAGKRGAILFAGATSIQDPVDRPVRQALNIVRVATGWLAAHPNAGLAEADNGIYEAVVQAMATFFSNRDVGAEADQYKFSIILAGFVEDKPVLMVTSYGLPQKGKEPRTYHSSDDAKPGSIAAYGEGGVEQRLLRGDRGPLQKFQAEPSLTKFHTRRQEMTDHDYLKLFDTILQASESAEGKQADHHLGPIAPPNRFATLSLKDGFKAQ